MRRIELHRATAILFNPLPALLALCLCAGCFHGPSVLKPRDQISVDRRVVEFPAGFECKLVATGFTAPTALAFDGEGTTFVAEAGLEGDEPKIYAIRPDSSLTTVYPSSRRIPFSPVQPGFQIYGPVGGMVYHQKRLYVSHRDKEGRGVITAFGLEGSHTTIKANLPAMGDYGVTDMAIFRDRLYYGIGSATNSGVVGLDNLRWLRKHPKFSDQSFQNLELLGLRFNTRNPFAGLFGGSDVVNTGPFQPFGVSNQATIRRPRGDPNSAICSVSLTGGDPEVEAFGLHLPRGLVFNEYNWLLVANDGMEMRGSRPAKNDPDVIVRVIQSGGTGGTPTWGGFPDYATDGFPVTDARYQPPPELLAAAGFPKLTALLDQSASDLRPPPHMGEDGSPDTFHKAKFPPLSGAGKMDVGPTTGPFSKWRNELFVTLSGDRAPFATSGYPLIAPVGYKVVRVDVNTGKVEEFIHNTQFVPASKLQHSASTAIERPVDVKITPDGMTMYMLDMGQIDYKMDGRQKIYRGSGKLYKIVLSPASATTQP